MEIVLVRGFVYSDSFIVTKHIVMQAIPGTEEYQMIQEI